MFSWKKAVALTAVAAAALSALAGCSPGGGSSSTTSGKGGTLSMGLIVQNTTFEAPNMNWANETPYSQAVYDTLLQADPAGKLIPHLATQWSYDSAKTTLTMTLRDDVKFTDGTSFDASVAADNLNRFKKGTSTNASYLANMNEATAVDPTHLQVKLSKPDPALLNYLAQNAGAMESSKAFSNKNVKTVPVGSGPYVLDTAKTVPGSTYVFNQNPKYWDTEQQHYSKVVMNVYSTGTAVLNAIQGGQVNAAVLFDNTTLKQIEASGYTNYPIELSYQGLLLLDRDGRDSKPLGDVRVRQAINYAFNRPALLKAVAQGNGHVTTSIFPTTSAGYDKGLDSYYDYNPTKAKQLLAAAGYPDGFTLAMPEISGVGTVYPLVKEQLGAIGIKVQSQQFQIAQIFNAILAPKFSATWFQLQEDPNDWQLAQFSVTPNATWNPFKSTNPEIAGYLNTIQTGSQADADAAAKSLNTYLVKNAWFAPWYRVSSGYAADSTTTVTVQAGNSYPNLWNIQPK